MIKKISLIFILAAILFSCATLKQLTYNQAAIDQINVVTAAVNSIYDLQLSGTDKSYNGNASRYDNAAAEAQNLKAIDAGRTKALKLDDFIISRLEKYRLEHINAVTFNTSQLQIRKNGMATLLKSRAIAEPAR